MPSPTADSTSINFRCSHSLKSQILEELKEYGYANISEYIRVKAGIRGDKETLLNQRHLLEYRCFILSKISNNINQIAKAMNQNHYANDPEGIEYFSEMLTELLTEIDGLSE